MPTTDQQSQPVHLPKRTWAWVVLVAVIAALIWQLPQTIAERDAAYKAFSPMVDVRSEIHRRTVRSVDDRQLLNSAVQAGIGAMLEQLNDPYALYLTDAEYQQFKQRTEGVTAGIGLEIWKTESGFEVLRRAPGSPAEAAGILPGDMLLAIDGETLLPQSLEAVENELLGGSVGSSITLLVQSKSSPAGDGLREVELKRSGNSSRSDPRLAQNRQPEMGFLAGSGAKDRLLAND